jgi:L-glutamine-phosphate cytidylyltransferase
MASPIIVAGYLKNMISFNNNEHKSLVYKKGRIQMKAIILAAGMGTRLKPLTDTTPKSLISVDGQPMLERQIEFLQEKDITEIVVVTGYLKHKFDYLKEKYGVTLIHNDKYDIYNNVYTMYLVRQYLQDAYVTEADVYMKRNYFETSLQNSTYFTGIKEDFKGEWMLRFDANLKVKEIEIGDGTDYILSGVSYWTKKDGEFIKEQLEEIIENGDFEKFYWDDIVRLNLNHMDIHVKKIDSNDWFEIDSIDDLNKTEQYLSSLSNK